MYSVFPCIPQCQFVTLAEIKFTEEEPKMLPHLCKYVTKLGKLKETHCMYNRHVTGI